MHHISHFSSLRTEVTIYTLDSRGLVHALINENEPKIIKNNKDFFVQSRDEIKLLKYVNHHDPADKYHLFQLYDFFFRVSGGLCLYYF